MASLSAIMAMNSPLVGLSSLEATLQPKARFSVSMRPRLQATSMAWRMARYTLLAVVLNRRPMPGYSSLVIRLMISGVSITIFTASRRNW